MFQNYKEMAEITTSILKEDFQKGFYLEADCFVCGNTETFVAGTEEELLELIYESSWEILTSDTFGAVGQWCGCDY